MRQRILWIFVICSFLNLNIAYALPGGDEEEEARFLSTPGGYGTNTEDPELDPNTQNFLSKVQKIQENPTEWNLFRFNFMCMFLGLGVPIVYTVASKALSDEKRHSIGEILVPVLMGWAFLNMCMACFLYHNPCRR